jgi:hypothetical protein
MRRVESAAEEIHIEAWIAERIPRWGDLGWWRGLIEAACDGRDPILSNLRITLAHQQLSVALHRVTGASSGANFHTWAVWSSKKAGQTIRKQDVPFLPRAGLGLGALTGAGAAAVRRDPLGASPRWPALTRDVDSGHRDPGCRV